VNRLGRIFRISTEAMSETDFAVNNPAMMWIPVENFCDIPSFSTSAQRPFTFENQVV